MHQSKGPPAPVVVVGAGMSGLTCALHLQERGHVVVLLEAEDGVGGRVRTDDVDGFKLDRGFQVLLAARRYYESAAPAWHSPSPAS